MLRLPSRLYVFSIGDVLRGYRQVIASGEDSISIDASALRYIDPLGLCMLAAMINQLIRRNIAVSITGMASDISAIDGTNKFVRPILAGNANSTVEISTPIICVTARQSEFEPAAELDVDHVIPLGINVHGECKCREILSVRHRQRMVRTGHHPRHAICVRHGSRMLHAPVTRLCPGRGSVYQSKQER